MFQIEAYKSIADQVYEYLKKQIIRGELRPGERVPGEEIAKQLNTSRTPVREAFKLLERDRLVERIPQGGVRVRVVSEKEVDQLFSVRKVLEKHACSIACDQITPEEISRLKDLEAAALKILDDPAISPSDKSNKVIDINTEFHQIIHRSCHNPYLQRILNELNEITLFHRSILLRDQLELQLLSWKEHHLYIKYLADRNKEELSKLVESHITSARNYLSDWFSKQSSAEIDANTVSSKNG